LFSTSCDDGSSGAEVVWDRNKERQWGLGASQLLKNYMELEDTQKARWFQKEVWITSKLARDAATGFTRRQQ